MRAWPMWSLRGPALAYVLLVQAVAVGLSIHAVLITPKPEPVALLHFGLLALIAGVVIVATSVSISVRHEIRRNPWTIHIAYLAAGVLTLPVNLLVLLLLGPALHGILDGRPRLHRWMFTTSATALATFAARATVGWEEPAWTPLWFLAGGAVLVLVRALLVAIGIRLRRPSARRHEVLGDPIDVLLAIVAATLGGLIAVAMLAEPISALLAAPPLALLDLASQLPQWRRSAQRDAKTGLANVLHWERVASTELTRARIRGRSAAVLLIDLDHFKRVNDENGHLAGDAVLSSVAIMLTSSVRREDVVGRFGGEEFVVLLPRTDPEEAYAAAQRVRRAISTLSVQAQDLSGTPRELSDLTASIGVATTAKHGYELPDLLGAADAALMSAKAEGRNLVNLA